MISKALWFINLAENSPRQLTAELSSVIDSTAGLHADAV